MKHDRFHMTRIEILAPDGPTAFSLEQRLAHLAPVAVELAGTWAVEVRGGDDLEEIEAAVRHWLRDERLDSTELLVDGEPREVALPRPSPSAA